MAKAYYWHRFYSHQPDLNFDNPRGSQGCSRACSISGSGWASTACGLMPCRISTNAKAQLREPAGDARVPAKSCARHVDEQYPDRMLLAEANQWPEDAVAYFGDGDECHMAFHFPLMPRLFMAIRMEDRFPIVDILEQTPAIPETCQWALFLRNHDELTLEMVTDEERDYMYRVYAHDPKARINLGIRRRLAPLLGNDRRQIELMNVLLFSLPGTPVLYYGDEIGMGDNIYLGDRNGVRTPMQWSADRNAGFSRANPQKLYLPVIIDPEYHYETVNVEAQQNNPHSLLWWMRRLLRCESGTAFGRGTLEFLQPENGKVLAFLRRYENETILVVANLSRFVQHVSLDLPLFQGAVPVELFGQTEFPRVGSNPYFLSLGPHGFDLVVLRRDPAAGEIEVAGASSAVPFLAAGESWENILGPAAGASLEEILPDYLRRRRWFEGQPSSIKSAHITGALGTDAAGRDRDCARPRRLQGPGIPCLRATAGFCDRQPGRSDADDGATGDRRRTRRSRITRNRASWLTPCRTWDFCLALLDVMVRRRTVRGQAVNLSELPHPGSRVWCKETRLLSPAPRSNRATPR